MNDKYLPSYKYSQFCHMERRSDQVDVQRSLNSFLIHTAKSEQLAMSPEPLRTLRYCRHDKVVERIAYFVSRLENWQRV